MQARLGVGEYVFADLASPTRADVAHVVVKRRSSGPMPRIHLQVWNRCGVEPSGGMACYGQHNKA